MAVYVCVCICIRSMFIVNELMLLRYCHSVCVCVCACVILCVFIQTEFLCGFFPSSLYAINPSQYSRISVNNQKQSNYSKFTGKSEHKECTAHTHTHSQKWNGISQCHGTIILLRNETTNNNKILFRFCAFCLVSKEISFWLFLLIIFSTEKPYK